MINKTISSLQSGAEAVGNKYELHIRKKAIKIVNQKIKAKGLKISEINDADYEAMISDSSKDLRETYAKRAAGGLLAFVGLDFLMW